MKASAESRLQQKGDHYSWNLLPRQPDGTPPCFSTGQTSEVYKNLGPFVQARFLRKMNINDFGGFKSPLRTALKATEVITLRQTLVGTMARHHIRELQARYKPPTRFLLFMNGTTRLPTTITAHLST